MPTLSQIKQISEVETRFTVTGEDQARRAMEGVAGAQEKVARASEATATVTEQSTKRQLNAAALLDRERKRFDADYRQRQLLEKAAGTFERSLSQGLIDQTEHDRLYGLASAKLAPKTNDNLPGTRGLGSYDKSFVRYQAYDVASTLGSGGSLTTAAFQQGPQLLQQLADREGGLKTGLKQLGESALGLVTPFTVGATAVAGLGIAFGVAASQAARDQEMLEKSTRGIGSATGATVSQLDALARSSAEGSKVSTSAAREYVATYASLGTLAVPVIGELTRLTSEYARVTGQEGAAAATELGRAVSDGGAALDAVAGKLGGLDDRTRQLIETQREQADKSGAQATAAEYLKGSIDANAAATTGWAGAWNLAARAADSYWESAKRIAGIKLGIVPEGAADAVKRLQQEVDNINERRKLFGQEPMNGKDNSVVRDLGAAKVIADQERMIAEGKAAEERAAKASRTAGETARALDPLNAQYRDLVTKRNELAAAVDDPLTRSKLGNVSEVEQARDAYKRATDTLVDANGRLYSSEERLRMQDQLKADGLKATTTEQKALIAERQKAFDLAGKPLSPLQAGEQITRAGAMVRLEADAKAAEKGGGGKGSADSKDEYDRAVKSAEDRLRRQEQETKTYGLGAEAAARYRAETDLLTAAKRAERDITPELTAQITGYADKAAEAAKAQEVMREAMQTTDSFRNMGSDGLRSVVGDLTRGASAADLMNNATSRLKNSLANMASDQIAEGLFGKRGSSGGWLADLFKPSTAATVPAGAGEMGFFASLKGFLGFADGGFTGMGPKLEPAGIVHRGEYVVDAASVRRIGVPVLDAIRAGRPGYDTGGYVGPTPQEVRSSQAVAGAAAGGGTVSLQIVNNGTPQEVQEVKETRDGRGNRTITAQTRDMVASALQQPGSARQAAQRAARDRPIST